MATLKTLLDFLKKNWKYTVLIIAVIAISVRGCIRDKIIISQAKKLVEIGIINIGIENDRQTLEIQLKKLQSEYDKINTSNDSLKLVLKAKQKQLKDMEVQHQKEIAELLDVPADTIYIRLQSIYPNYDCGETKFPFSASQIKPIYSTALELPRLKDEYVLQGKTLKSCFDLNNGFELANKNLTDQIGNLKTDVEKADEQIKNYKAQEIILNDQVSKNKFWKRTLLITTGILTGVVILK